MEIDGNIRSDVIYKQFNPICLELVKTLEEINIFQQRFFPPQISRQRERLLLLKDSLSKARDELLSMSLPPELKEIGEGIEKSATLVLDAIEMITSASDMDLEVTVINVMRAFRKCCRAQEGIYLKRWISPHLNKFFLEPQVYDQAEKLDPQSSNESNVGLNHIGLGDQYYTRGATSLYIPESYDGSSAWPLVVALHGGHGHGRDFIWTWLREARSRRFLLLSPTSSDTTWSLLNPELDGTALISMIDHVKHNWNIDMDRILLTGISDGATFALICSLQKTLPFSAYAPIAGVLPPYNIKSVKGKRIYWVHGALDWMFPVAFAKEAFEALELAGAEITLRVIEDLSHTYPRDENDRILTWFDPGLALPVNEMKQ